MQLLRPFCGEKARKLTVKPRSQKYNLSENRVSAPPFPPLRTAPGGPPPPSHPPRPQWPRAGIWPQDGAQSRPRRQGTVHSADGPLEAPTQSRKPREEGGSEGNAAERYSIRGQFAQLWEQVLGAQGGTQTGPRRGSSGDLA